MPSMTDGIPPIPARTYPSPRSPRGPIVVWVVLGVICLALPVVGIGALVVFATSFDEEFLDDPALLTVVERECDVMTKSVDRAVKSSAGPEAIATDQNAAIQLMVDQIRTVDHAILESDEPALEWLSDWESLIEVRSEHDFATDDGFDFPTDDGGDWIIDRMDWAGEPECVVPESILEPA